jgi:putative restriction endonuclease
LRAFIAVTDPAWLRRLREAHVDEANFWQPRPTPIRQPIGTPWIFKVKGTERIAGFGILSHYTTMPAAIAWDVFGIANGAESYAEMRRSIARLRHSNDADETIGCVVLSNIVILPEARYISSPTDWKSNIVRGKYYDLGTGAGAVAWLQLMAATEKPQSMNALAELPGGFGQPTMILPRRGQGSFRLMVMDAYDRRCAISGERNGVLLRSDIHRLFDQGYVTITPDHRFCVSQRIRDEFDNGVIYYDLHGRQIRLPSEAEHQPDPSALEWHSTSVFKG